MLKTCSVCGKIHDFNIVCKRPYKYKKSSKRPRWPIIILRTPKGWTGPKEVDDKQIEGSFRSHQVPIIVNEEHKESTIVDKLFDLVGEENVVFK